MLVIAIVSTVLAVLLTGLVLVQRHEINMLTAPEVPGGSRQEVITIAIRNHTQLATSRTFLAAPVAVVSPSLIRSIVHKETLRIVRKEMANHGVDADVRLRTIAVAVTGAAGAGPDDAGPDR